MIRERHCNLVVDIILKAAENNKIDTEEDRQCLMSEKILQYQVMMGEELSEEEVNYIERIIEYTLSVQIKRGSALHDSSYIPWYSEKKSKITPIFWNRFRNLLQGNELPPSVIGHLDLESNEILDYAGDPSVNGCFQRKGLVVGDVQSGKTNSYLSVICKAIDAGYNFIIVLAGNTDSLRNQTQNRVDDAIIGFSVHPDYGKKPVGVGILDPTPEIIAMTSASNDFKIQFKSNHINSSTPTILVIKKLVPVLTNVYEWLKKSDSNELIDKSLLLIDDESDYASVNTHNEDITGTNKNIRGILSLFNRATYIGYTATPYANIFVHPDSYDSMVKEDLFPKNFIYCLGTPSNYVGPISIFDYDGKHNYMLKTIPNSEVLFDGNFKHKKTAKFEEMPNSMKDAISCFFLACTLRDLKGDFNKPMSMMVHVTRFIDVQASVLETIEEFVMKMKEDVISYYALPVEKALQNESMAYIYKIWQREYSKLNLPNNTWESIQTNIASSIHKIRTKVINSENEKSINYNSNPSLRAIIIGGNSLTRGLTLEGLMVSYFYRKSKQYDSLLQMGRWFGYREGYAELCRVWTHSDVQNWFGYVGRVNEELKQRIEIMCDMKKTPEEYGLCVQEDISGFSMTSRQKMKNSGVTFIIKNLSGDVRETSYIFADYDNITKNHMSLNMFYSRLNNICNSDQIGNGHIIWENIPSHEIINLIENIKIPSCNVWFGVEEFSNYISEHTIKWDVAIVSHPKDYRGSFEKITYSVNESEIICPIRHRCCMKRDDNFIVEMGNRTVSTPSDLSICLSDSKKKNVKDSVSPSSPSAKDYMISDRNPLLLIYYIDMDLVEHDVNSKKLKEEWKKIPPVGFVFGFPAETNNNSSSKKVIKYRVNKIYERMRERDGE